MIKLTTSGKRILLIAGKVLITIILLVILFQYIELRNLRASLQQADRMLILFAFLLSVPNLLIQAARWQLLIKSETFPVTFLQSMKSLLGGLVFGMITPGRVGEIGRIFLLQIPSKIRLAGLHVLDKLYSAGLIAATGPVMIFLLPDVHNHLNSQLKTGVFLLLTLIPLIYFWLLLDQRPLKSFLIAIQLNFQKQPRFLELLRVYDNWDRRKSSYAMLLTLGQFAIILTQFYILISAFEPVSWNHAAQCYLAVLFAKTFLPFSIGSLGIGEWASMAACNQYGIAVTASVNASLILMASNVLIPSIAGMVILLVMKPSLKDATESSKSGIAA